jgi:hypothetical protein
MLKPICGYMYKNAINVYVFGRSPVEWRVAFSVNNGASRRLSAVKSRWRTRVEVCAQGGGIVRLATWWHHRRDQQSLCGS